MHNRYAFVGATSGNWRVLSSRPACGEGLPDASYVAVVPASGAHHAAAAWIVEGQISNLRYATRAEVDALKAKQEGLGRAQANRAALIPIKKRATWWQLAQDERRGIFEAQSRHTAIGLDYLPMIARQLYHCRDLEQPFDFLTWFEYDARHADQFEQLVQRLRATPEWSYVEREIDIRLERTT